MDAEEKRKNTEGWVVNEEKMEDNVIVGTEIVIAVL